MDSPRETVVLRDDATAPAASTGCTGGAGVSAGTSPSIGAGSAVLPGGVLAFVDAWLRHAAVRRTLLLAMLVLLIAVVLIVVLGNLYALAVLVAAVLRPRLAHRGHRGSVGHR